MEAYQRRVVEEKAELDSKIKKLDEFILTESFEELDMDEQDLLERQLSIMQDYSEILADRIRYFS